MNGAEIIDTINISIMRNCKIVRGHGRMGAYVIGHEPLGCFFVRNSIKYFKLPARDIHLQHTKLVKSRDVRVHGQKPILP